MIDFASLFDPAAAEVASCPLDLNLSTIEVAAALKGTDHFVFLDSSDASAAQGGFSILAYDPLLVFRSKNRQIQIRHGRQWHELPGDPFAILQKLLSAAAVKDARHPSLPFCGGAVGYFGYDLFRFLERYDHLTAVDDLHLPDCYLSFYDTALLYDHRHGRWHLAGTSACRETGRLHEALNRKREELFDRLEDGQKSAAPHRQPPKTAPAAGFAANFTKEEYLKAVERALEHIYAGDIYQVNLSQRFHKTVRSSPFEIFRTLRRINPSQFGGYLQYDGHTVISSSPELFLRTAESRVETKPIKGTRPRGQTPAEDERLRRELQDSYKDQAELSMIVDLERNDLGRVCAYGSVRVDEHAYIEPLPTVFHTVSQVSGTLREDVGLVELLRATFPGGSITGCPKIRSIEIIDDLEPTWRNVYTGSIGFIGYSGDLTLNIVIRTMITKGPDVYFQVGGGIVADSDPQAEYDETMDKAAALIRALQTVDESHEQ